VTAAPLLLILLILFLLLLLLLLVFIFLGLRFLRFSSFYLFFSVSLFKV